MSRAAPSLRARVGRLALLSGSLLVAALLSACAVGPDYRRPELALPERYVAAPAVDAGREQAAPPGAAVAAAAVHGVDAAGVAVQSISTVQAIPERWWLVFHSQALDDWVATSLARNPGIEAAQAALRAAHENALAEAGAFWPSVGLGFQSSRQEVAGTLASPVSTNADLYNLHTAQLTVAYAPDVFGGVRRAVESAEAQSEQQRFQLEAARLNLSANVVVAAINEASLRAQRDATLAIIEDQRRVLESMRRQQVLGQLSAADVDAQRAALAAIEAGLPPIDKQLALQRHQLLTLSGRYPSQEPAARFELDALELPAELPLVLPAQLVDRRPDVLAAEAQMRSASAAIGVAVAARLPNVLLGVNAYGSSAFSLGELFSSPTRFWTLAAGLTQPLVDGGALQHREAAARAVFEQSAAQYRATVLSAFQDVANALVAIDADTRALQGALVAEHAYARSLERARAQLRLGDASALAVLQAEQGWQQARLQLVQARAARLSDSAALFLALGGGWYQAGDGSAPIRRASTGSD